MKRGGKENKIQKAAGALLLREMPKITCIAMHGFR